MPSPKKYQVAEINKWESESAEAKSRILWSEEDSRIKASAEAVTTQGPQALLTMAVEGVTG